MSRINVEDDWFADVTRRRAALIAAVATRPRNVTHEADGMALDAWRLSQRYWVDGRKLIPEDVWSRAGLEALIECDLAARENSGVYVRGTRERHEWLRQRTRAGRKGGKNSGKARRKDSKQTRSKREANASKTKPPAPAPAPAPALETSSKSLSDPARRELKPRVKTRALDWATDDPMAGCFENLKRVRAYWAVFDREHDRGTLLGHLDRNPGLTLKDLEQVTWELRNWADGPAGEKIKSPRGLLATFVQKHAERKRAEKPAERSGPPLFNAETFR